MNVDSDPWHMPEKRTVRDTCLLFSILELVFMVALLERRKVLFRS
jgi:hypothetical protein